LPETTLHFVTRSGPAKAVQLRRAFSAATWEPLAVHRRRVLHRRRRTEAALLPLTVMRHKLCALSLAVREVGPTWRGWLGCTEMLLLDVLFLASGLRAYGYGLPRNDIHRLWFAPSQHEHVVCLGTIRRRPKRIRVYVRMYAWCLAYAVFS
jgi:hypothetical protein